MQKKFYKYMDLKTVIELEKIKKPLIVCDSFIKDSFLIDYLNSLDIQYSIFCDFKPNPLYEDVIKGIEVLEKNECDFVISIGGGSAIDVAKCINLFSNLDSSINYLKQEFNGVKFKHLAIPTTAGTGSESTRYAVIYYNGQKQSVMHTSIIPDYAILDGKMLETLPLYQKKSTILDALSQAIESYWSVNSTEESKELSKKAITLILDNIDDYIFKNDNSVNDVMIKASNLSGEAINITQTTAAHAMSYKLTSLYKIPHGQAVFTTLPYIFEYMVDNLDNITDKRGKEYLKNTFKELTILFNCKDEKSAVEMLKKLFESFGFEKIIPTEEELDILVNSVNPIRLSNNPVILDKNNIEKIYIKSLER